MPFINVTIDGVRTQVMRDCTILDAAKRVNVSIPTLCHHRDLTPTGSCRICVVEVEGQRGLQVS